MVSSGSLRLDSSHVLTMLKYFMNSEGKRCGGGLETEAEEFTGNNQREKSKEDKPGCASCCWSPLVDYINILSWAGTWH